SASLARSVGVLLARTALAAPDWKRSSSSPPASRAASSPTATRRWGSAWWVSVTGRSGSVTPTRLGRARGHPSTPRPRRGRTGRGRRSATGQDPPRLLDLGERGGLRHCGQAEFAGAGGRQRRAADDRVARDAERGAAARDLAHRLAGEGLLVERALAGDDE